MKKTLVIAVLFILSFSLFAEVHYEYASWNDIKTEWAADSLHGKEFRENERRLHVQYEAAQLTVIPFLESIGPDVDIRVSFGSIPEDTYGVSIGTWIYYQKDGVCIDFCNGTLDPGGFHAYAAVHNQDLTVAFEHFLLKSDGSFVSGTCDNIRINCMGGASYNLSDVHLVQTDAGVAILGKGTFEYDGLSLCCTLDDIRIPICGDVPLLDAPDAEYSYAFNGYTFRGRGLSISETNTMTAENCELVIRNQSYPFGTIRIENIYTYPRLASHYKTYGIEINPDSRVSLGSFFLTNAGLNCSVYFAYPAPFTGQGIKCLNCDVAPDGTLGTLYPDTNIFVRIGDSILTAEEISISDDDFQFSDVIFSIPENHVFKWFRDGHNTYVLSDDGVIEMQGDIPAAFMFNGDVPACVEHFKTDGEIIYIDGYFFSSSVVSGSDTTGFTLELDTDGNLRHFESLSPDFQLVEQQDGSIAVSGPEEKYHPFGYFLYDYMYDDDFLAQQDELRAEYDEAIRDILPFIEAANPDADIDVDFEYYEDDWEEGYEVCVSICTDDLGLCLSGMCLEEDGLHARANVINARNSSSVNGDVFIYMFFDDFLMKSDGTFVSGQCNNNADDNLMMFLKAGYSFALLDARIEDTPEGRIVISDDIGLYAYNTWSFKDEMWSTIKAGSATFDWEGNLLSYTPGDALQELEINGTVCTLTHVEWCGDEMIAEGEVMYEDIDIRVKSKDIRIDCATEFVTVDESDAEYTFNLFDFPCKGKGFTVHYDGPSWNTSLYVTLNDTEILINGETYPMGCVDMTYCDGELGFVRYPGIAGSIMVTYSGSDACLENLAFTEDGIEGVLRTSYPEPFRGRYENGRAMLYHDGSIDVEEDFSSYGWRTFTTYLGNFSFSSKYVNQDEDGFCFDEAGIRTPENCVVQNLALDFGALYIHYDGTAEIKGIGYPFHGPGKFCDMTYSADMMYFLNDSIRFTGPFYLPNSLPGVLSGKAMGLDLVLNLDGSIRSVASKLSGSYQIDVPESDLILSFDGAELAVEQSAKDEGLSPGKAYLVLNRLQLYTTGGGQLSSQLKDILATVQVAFAVDGTLCYKMPDMNQWEALDLGEENLLNQKD